MSNFVTYVQEAKSKYNIDSKFILKWKQPKVTLSV